MDTYLSVDLDYWNKVNQRRSCIRFIRKVLGLGVPTLVVLSHDDLLNDVDRSGCRRIEHVDYHSDVVDYPKDYTEELVFDAGTWLSFVRWRSRGELLWRFPTWKCYRNGWGTCHGPRDPFKEDVSGWALINLQRGVQGIPWESIARVGIAVSFEYWGSYHHEDTLPELLGTETYQEALKIAESGKLGKRGKRRIIRKAA